MLHIVFEVTLEDAAALEDDLSLSFFLAFSPVALINGLIDYVLPRSMAETVFNLALVAAAVGPLIVSLASDAIVDELSTVNDAICPGEGALTTEESVVEVAIVGVAVLEGDFSWSVEALAIDLAVLGGGGYLALPALVEYLGEFDG